MGFKLIRVDAQEPAKIPLAAGTHVIGRGSILDCDDQRVSRQHGLMKVTHNKVILKAIHSNPCFYNQLPCHKVIVLTEGKHVSLSNTDQFGLLPDTFWYELVFCEEDMPLILPEHNNPNIIRTSELVSGKTFSTQYPLRRSSLMAEVKDVTNTISGYVNSDLLGFNLRDYVDGNDSDRDTLNLDLDDLLEGSSSAASVSALADCLLARTPQDDEPDTGEVTPGKRSQSPGHGYNAKKIKTEQCGSNTTSPNMRIDDETVDGEMASGGVDTGGFDTGRVSPGKRSHSPEPGSDAKKIKTEPGLQNSADVASQSQIPDAITAGPQNTNHGKDVKNEPGSSQDQQGSSNDGAAAAKAARERCIYGANCYRKNPQHKVQFSHPGDADHGPGARGECPYGAACRRSDPRHWLQHDHPAGTAPPAPPAPLAARDQGNPTKKRKYQDETNDTEDSDGESALPDKRKRKIVQRVSYSDSGEGSQDPFATDDDSDDWQPQNDE